MSGPFVSDEMMPISVKYVEQKLSSGFTNIIIVQDEKAEKKYSDRIKTINTQWKIPNWKESNDLARQCYRWDPIAGEKILDWNLYRMSILDTYMQFWDVSIPGPNGGDQSVPCTPENISKLQPAIGDALVGQFMQSMSPSDEEMGN